MEFARAFNGLLVTNNVDWRTSMEVAVEVGRHLMQGWPFGDVDIAADWEQDDETTQDRL